MLYLIDVSKLARRAINKVVISGVKEGGEVGIDGWVGESDVGTLEEGIAAVPDG